MSGNINSNSSEDKNIGENSPHQSASSLPVLAKIWPVRTRRPFRPLALTDERIEQIYPPFLERVEQRFPFLAAETVRMKDLLSRYAFTVEREQKVRQEAEQRLQQRRKEAASRKKQIEEELQQLNEQIDEVSEQYAQRIKESQEELLAAHQEVSRLSAKCGLLRVEVRERVDGVLNDEGPADPPGAQPQPSSTPQAPSNGPSFLAKVGAFFRRPNTPPQQLGQQMGEAAAQTLAASNGHSPSRTEVQMPPSSPAEPHAEPPPPWHFEPDYEEVKQEARKQAPSVEALAAEQGYFSRSPAARVGGPPRWGPIPPEEKGWFVWVKRGGIATANACASIARWLLTLLATLFCGTIFGVSVGILLGIISKDFITVAPQKQIVYFALLAVFGSALFWVLGHTTQALAALVAEVNTNANTTLHRDNIQSIGKWLSTAGRVFVLLLIVVLVFFIFIEASVEKNGIIRFFMDNMANAQIASGQHLNTSSISNFEAWILALIACVPFLVWHFTEGLIQGREGAMQQSLLDLRDKKVQERADDIYANRKALAQNRIQQQAELYASNISSQSPPPPSPPANQPTKISDDGPIPPASGTSNAAPSKLEEMSNLVSKDPHAVAHDMPSPTPAGQTATIPANTSPDLDNGKGSPAPDYQIGTSNPSPLLGQPQPDPQVLGELGAAIDRAIMREHHLKQLYALLIPLRDEEIRRLKNRKEELEKELKSISFDMSSEDKEACEIAVRQCYDSIRACDNQFNRLRWRYALYSGGGLLPILVRWFWCPQPRQPLPLRMHNGEPPALPASSKEHSSNQHNS